MLELARGGHVFVVGCAMTHSIAGVCGTAPNEQSRARSLGSAARARAVAAGAGAAGGTCAAGAAGAAEGRVGAAGGAAVGLAEPSGCGQHRWG